MISKCLYQKYQQSRLRGGGVHLKPLDSTPFPNSISPNWNRNDYFAFHQRIVLKTNSCLMLKHDVQDLIDSPSHNLKKWASEKQERMNKGMCLRDLIHVKTFVESFSIVVSPIYRVYLSVSQCCVVESFPYFFVELCSFQFSNQCYFTFNKDGHSNMTCIM